MQLKLGTSANNYIKLAHCDELIVHTNSKKCGPMSWYHLLYLFKYYMIASLTGMYRGQLYLLKESQAWEAWIIFFQSVLG